MHCKCAKIWMFTGDSIPTIITNTSVISGAKRFIQKSDQIVYSSRQYTIHNKIVGN